MEDFDIEVYLEIYANISTKRAEIIFGYEKSETDKSENYYLYAVNNHGYFFPLIVNNKEALLLLINRQLVLNENKINLKLKCLGPWIMLYSENKLLDSFLNKEFIKGRIGFYFDSNTYVEFSEVKISSTLETDR